MIYANTAKLTGILDGEWEEKFQQGNRQLVGNVLLVTGRNAKKINRIPLLAYESDVMQEKKSRPVTAEGHFSVRGDDRYVFLTSPEVPCDVELGVNQVTISGNLRKDKRWGKDRRGKTFLTFSIFTQVRTMGFILPCIAWEDKAVSIFAKDWEVSIEGCLQNHPYFGVQILVERII